MRKLGQHFLKDKQVLEKIAQAAAGEERIIVEIGPGHGELTDVLRAKDPGAEIIVIERDKVLAAGLRERFEAGERMRVLEGDALMVLPEVALQLGKEGAPYRLVGNIPYYITGHLMRTIGELDHPPARSVFLLQKEVAERIAARPPHMNRLAAAVQFWGAPEVLFSVGRGKFDPPPDVESAVLRLTTRTFVAPQKDRYFAAVRAIFQQPRKTLANNLKEVAADAGTALRQLGFSEKIRPQDLSIDDIARIAIALPALSGRNGE